jgi:hypothetical protein
MDRDGAGGDRVNRAAGLRDTCEGRVRAGLVAGREEDEVDTVAQDPGDGDGGQGAQPPLPQVAHAH